MRSYSELNERLTQYRGAKFIYDETGYIAWQVSTGENIEIVFIEVKEKGKGYATELLRKMCREIQPFTSIFVFRLASNETAGHFYRKMGFRETHISGLYRTGAVLGVVPFETLKQNLGLA